jgi:plasmid stability protein
MQAGRPGNAATGVEDGGSEIRYHGVFRLVKVVSNDYYVINDDAEAVMASITIRNLDDSLKSRLRIRAAVHGRSMEDEARDILRSAINQEAQALRNLGTAIHELFKPLGGFDLPDIPREPIREPPSFEG